MTMLQKIVIGLSAFVVIGGAFAEVSALSLLPFVVFAGLAYAQYVMKKYNSYIVILAIIMTIINFSATPPGWLDVAIWIAIAIAYWQE